MLWYLLFTPVLGFLTWKFVPIPPQILQYCELGYKLARNYFIEWLDVTNMTSTEIKDVKWIDYTYNGEKYLIPYKRTRASNITIDDFDKEFGVGVRGPYGDYHGQYELLRNIYDARHPR